MIKVGLFLLLALFVDGFVAAVCLIIFIVSAFPLTLLGTAAGCATGAGAASSVGASATAGCQIGALIGGIVGSLPGAQQAVTVFTLPMGAALGFGVSIVLNIVFGGLLFAALFFAGVFDLRVALLGGGKIIPVLNLFPWYFGMVCACFWIDAMKKREVTPSGKLTTATEQVGSVTIQGAPVGGVTTLAQTRVSAPQHAANQSSGTVPVGSSAQTPVLATDIRPKYVPGQTSVPQRYAA